MEYPDVPCGTIDNYLDLLLTWNKKINLISARSREELIERHVLDSLQLMSYINRDDVVFDIGSGAGFPGLMLSYAGIRNVNLVESNHKKASFLTVAAALSSNKILIHNSNSSDLKESNCNVITARGLASLEEIFSATINLVNRKTKYILLKGKNHAVEIKKALDKWNFKYIIHHSKTSKEGFIVEVEHLRLNE